MALERIEKISKLSKKIAAEAMPQEPNKDHFESLMNQRRVSSESIAAESNKEATKVNSLFDEVRNLNQKVEQVIRSSPAELAAQTEDVIAQIDTLKHKLQTPNLEVKGSVQSVLRDKLSHIDESLKIALDNAGIEYKPPERATSLNKPIDRFLGLLTHSQNQLATLTSDVQALAASGNQLSPAAMILVQIKVGHIQQEIELFTSMLNKALESTKTIMNVQV